MPNEERAVRALRIVYEKQGPNEQARWNSQDQMIHLEASGYWIAVAQHLAQKVALNCMDES